MGRSQRNDNFIDKTFTILADILLKVFPASKQEKQAFFYYRDGMSAQAEGDYAEALEYYQQALELNSNLPQALNNIAVIYHYQGSQAVEKQNTETSKALFDKAGEYWRQAIRLAPNNYIEAQNWLKTTGRISSDLI
jgi:tetratricopeptide (TPR) repeat protein